MTGRDSRAAYRNGYLAIRVLHGIGPHPDIRTQWTNFTPAWINDLDWNLDCHLHDRSQEGFDTGQQDAPSSASRSPDHPELPTRRQ